MSTNTNNPSPSISGTEKTDGALHSTQPSIRESDSEKVQPPQPYGGDIPDGGLSAWLVVAGGWCISFSSFGWLSSIGTFQEYYGNVLLREYSPSTISWILSIQIFLMMGMGPFVGLIYDKYGPRWLILIGSILHVFGVMMASISTEYWQILLSQGLVSGLGASAIFQPSMSCLFTWFNKRRAAAFGILSTGSSLGGIVFPIMVTNLIRRVGYPWAMRSCGFLLLALLIFANLTVRSRTPPHPQKVTASQLVKPFKETDFVLVAVGFFVFTYGFFATLNYLPLQVLEAGMRPALAQYILSILNAGSLFGRLAAGFAGDKIGRYNVFIVVCYAASILILALWLPSSNDAALIAFAVLFGFMSGAYVSLIAPLVMQISPIAEIGFRTGLVMFTVSIGGLTTNPINGALLERPGRFDNLMIFSGVLSLVGTTFILVARLKRTGLRFMVAF
ncbi:major facilitator superfamily domain-containing protein [Stachybotrys elegans]|uniref:Major facilitator superfamily domain-containing protein n=1 Tax=Stachybotrys elegans TaxID=80388 RepID=A0A8K0WUL8_9HYPO|nr:major facilitator superfamily domain-containing protein [Stachybotrys elegans]